MNERTRELLEDVQSDLEALRSQLAMMRCSAEPTAASAQLMAIDLHARRAISRVAQARRPR